MYVLENRKVQQYTQTYAHARTHGLINHWKLLHVHRGLEQHL